MASGTRVPGPNYAQADAPRIAILYQETPRSYEVIGFIAVDTGAGVGQNRIDRAFRLEASKVGPDAALIEALPHNSGVSFVQGRAKAIKWKP